MTGFPPTGASAAEAALVGAVADAVWSDLGVDRSTVAPRQVRTRRRVGGARTRHLPADDRWTCRATWVLTAGRTAGGAHDVVELVTRGAGERGWAVTTWRSTGSGTRLVDAVAEDAAAHVRLHVTAEGAVTLVVRAGPAAVATAAPPEAPYVAEGP